MSSSYESRLLQNILLVVASTTLALLAAEVMARMMGIGLNFGRIMEIHDVPTRTVDGVVLWGEPQPRYDNEDLRRAADPGAFTIVGLGDSILYGAPYEREQTYLEQARRVIAGRSPRRIEVVNLAVPGFNTRQEDAIYKELEGQLKPDLVLVHYWGDDWHQYRVVGGYVVDIGDISDDGRLVVRALPLPARVSDFLLLHSRLYDRLTQWVLAQRPHPMPHYESQVYKPLAAIQERAQRAGGRLLVLASPRLDGPLSQPTDDLAQLQEFAATRGFEVIDGKTWVDGIESKRIAFDGCHFNAEGHRLMGDRLAEYLLERDLKE